MSMMLQQEKHSISKLKLQLQRMSLQKSKSSMRKLIVFTMAMDFLNTAKQAEELERLPLLTSAS
jgi:hypothetical protein